MFRKIRVGSGKAVGFHCLSMTTARAPITENCPIGNLGFPFMIVCFRALPPYSLITPCRDIFGLQSIGLASETRDTLHGVKDHTKNEER